MGWDEYLTRLKRQHTVRVTQIPDKWAYDPKAFGRATAGTFCVALAITGKTLDSPALASFLTKQGITGKEISFIIGGPEGLPEEVLTSADYKWSLSPLTFPHDLAMVIMLEALYRASTIIEGHPYHKA